MVGFFIFLVGLVTFLVTILFLAVYTTSDSFHCWVNELCGEDIIIVEESNGESWPSTVTISPINGKRIAYRYPTSKIGAVTLEPNGTGSYNGKVVWRLKSEM